MDRLAASTEGQGVSALVLHADMGRGSVAGRMPDRLGGVVASVADQRDSGMRGMPSGAREPPYCVPGALWNCRALLFRMQGEVK
jgi:hypothetical protein